MMAGRYLRARKAEGFVSVIAGFSFLGILLGVATLIIVMSVMNGFRQELMGRLLGLNGHISVYAQSGPLTGYEDLVAQLKGVQGVESASAQIESQALLTVSGVSTGVMVRGITAEDFAGKPILSDSITGGDLASFEGASVAVGEALAKRLRLAIGDEIVLMSPKARSTPFGGIPRQMRAKVAMVFDVGMYEYNNGFVYMPLSHTQKFFQMSGGVSEIEIVTDDPLNINVMRDRIEMVVEGRAGVYDWRDTNSSFFNALQVERNVMFLILTMIILVAAFNIISSMIMLVKDKARDIAIMRTMGATRASIMKIFMLTGASIGLAGTVGGALAGIAFALNIESIRQVLEGLTGKNLFSEEIYFLSKLPAEIDWAEVTAVVAIAFVLSFGATVFPALRAARLDPVEALRYE